MPRMRYNGAVNGVLPHVHGGGWDDSVYLAYFAGRMAGNIAIDEEVLRFFFSLMSKQGEEDASESIFRYLASLGYDEERGRRAGIRNIGSILEEVKSPDVHRTCGEIILELLDVSDSFPSPSLHEQRLVELFELRETERRILDFFLSYSVHNTFSGYCRNLPWKDQYSFLSLTTDCTIRDLEDAFRRDAPLIKNGILDPGHRRQSSGIMEMELNADIISSMSSPDGGIISLPDHVLRDGQVYPLESFPVESELTEPALALVRGEGPHALLLYGAPGAGKTEYARSLAHAAGKNARFFYSEDSRAFETKKFRLRYLNRIMDPAGDVLVVDEAEELLRTQQSLFSLFGGGGSGGEKTGNKSFINLFLEDFRGVIIFIVNSTRGMDSSLKRRFHLSVHFPENNLRRRLEFWKDGLERRGLSSLFSESELRSLAADFPVSAGAIAAALDTAAASTSGAGRQTSVGMSGVGEAETSRAGARSPADTEASTLVPADYKQTLRRLLSAQLELQSGRPAGKKMEEEYEVSEDILCTDSPLDELFDAASHHRTGMPLSILFSGPPGTGKTTLAGRIAERQGRELRTVRASDILAPYVGQNEQNVRRVFSSADPRESVLFIDEADSLFYNRSATRSEWRQSLTNELLSAMESYPGILICATNMIDHLDAALMRRFAFKVRFRPLRPEQRLEAIRLHFPGLTGCEPGREERRRLDALHDLTPGDIAAVRRRLQLAGKAETRARSHSSESEPAPTPAKKAEILRRVLDELEAECSYRSSGKAIGFV